MKTKTSGRLGSHDIHLHLTKLEEAVKKTRGPFYSEVKSRAEILFTVVISYPR